MGKRVLSLGLVKLTRHKPEGTYPTEMKYVWKIMVHGDLEQTDSRQGYALAGSMGEALELAGCPDAVAIPQVGRLWPGDPGQSIVWLG